MADPSEMLIRSNQSFPEGYLCCNPSLFISQPAKAPTLTCAMTQKLTGIKAPQILGFKWCPSRVSKEGFYLLSRQKEATIAAPVQKNEYTDLYLLAKDKGKKPIKEPINTVHTYEKQSDVGDIYKCTFDLFRYPLYIDGFYEYKGIKAHLSSELVPMKSM